jgi:hypothetical protein
MDKAHILREIQRTAAANGGVALGVRRFFSETGIKQSDWFGVYWARWNDAVQEAGLAPNQLTEAYGDAELLDKYAKLALELRRLPAKGDLRLKARNDPDFPHETTFARLGKKSQLLLKLLEYCRDREGYEDVARWCNEYAPHNRDLPDESEPNEETEMGFVYLMKAGRFYKIGKTNSTGRRQYELSIQLPERLETIHIIPTDDPGGIEGYWHKRFEAKRRNGEWFELDPADVAAFKHRKFM